MRPSSTEEDTQCYSLNNKIVNRAPSHFECTHHMPYIVLLCMTAVTLRDISMVTDSSLKTKEDEKCDT